MPIVTDLPCEVIAGVLRGLDDVRFLLPTILACRHLYASYKEYPSVAFDILCRQIGPALLPYSIATFEASRLPKPHTPSSVQQLLDALYNDPGSLVCRLRGRPLSVLGEVAQTHETIEKHASASALDSWLLAAAYSERLRPRCITLPANSALSTAELLRFRRAFYRVKLFVRLFHRDQDRENTALEVQKIEFMSRYSPWAIEQFGCVYYYIEQKIFEGTLDVVCRDDDFRQPLVLRMNDTLPYRWRQLWASTNRYRGASGDRQLRHYSDEEIKALGPNQDQEDIDDGPFKTWKSRYAPCYRDKWALGSYSWQQSSNGSPLRKVVVKYANNDAAISTINSETQFLRRLQGHAHIVQPIIENVEYLPNSSLETFLDRSRARVNRGLNPVPNRVLWQIFRCLARMVVGMATPAVDDGNFRSEKVRASLEQPSILDLGTQQQIYHGDLANLKNCIFGDYDTSEHSLVPILKAIDFGEGTEDVTTMRASLPVPVTADTITQGNIFEIGRVMQMLFDYFRASSFQTFQVLRPNLDEDLYNLAKECADADHRRRPSAFQLLQKIQTNISNKRGPEDFLGKQFAEWESNDRIREYMNEMLPLNIIKG
ncbi:hypothetical protein CIB48_g4274 [Xylaria polymorpha]|nr:hypothetical protein CIB48_g4274 [Xylaria polymorpha]